MTRTSFLIVLLICMHTSLTGVRSSSAEETSTQKLTYEQHIRPIFRAHCFDCHGATAELEGGLDLRLVRLMKAGGDSGASIVPGDPEESLLLQRVIDGEMPPGDHNVPDEETAILKQWIAAGAPTARKEPDSIGPGLGITPEERAYWAFQPIATDEAPPLADHPRVRNPIDSIVLRDGEGQPVPLEPEADRTTLVIRVYFDLVGLPPSAEEVQRWRNDSREDWYDHLLTELLDSPHYGERWGRHWLDVAGYADSEGYTVADPERAWAWKYRDWVIRALNADKPFDQFIIQQLAGDELAGPRNGDLTAEQIELLTATGFLRMAADGTGNGANHDEARNQVMIDTIKIVGTSLMGLSFHCAQCHDHRYDPILQTDYYALRAVFEPALDWKDWKTPGARLVSLYTAADRERSAEVEIEAKKIEQERSQRQAEYMKQALDKELLNYEEPLRTSLRQAYQTPAKERNDEQKKLLAANPSVNITPGNLYQYIPDSKPKLAEISKRIAEVRAEKPTEEFLRALVEPAGHVPETKLFHRGDPGQPKQTVMPAAPEVASPEGRQVEFPVNDPEFASTGRRLAFAHWLTDRDNPLLSRVIVNRVWMHHFGKGLVATPGEFGKLGAMPSDPRLLDWLAAEFVEQGWSLKRLHRLILSSALWRQSVVPTSANPYARTLRRLEAETIRDRMLVASGSLDRRLFGPPVNIKEDETGQVVVDGPQSRRSLYVQARRSRPVALLQTFDAPVMETNCENRVSSTVATQSLMLLNGEFILDQSAKLADRAAQEAVALPEQRLASLPQVPAPKQSQWQYGHGGFDEDSERTKFTPFPHWTGTHWSGGETLPDTQLGWAHLSAGGGHPHDVDRSVVRRWVAPRDGVIAISGALHHPSTNGDGVRGRIVSSRSGLIGDWVAQHGTVETTVDRIELRTGDTIDFITDCRTNHTSDSFTWPVMIRLTEPSGADEAFRSQDQFAGPAESTDAVPGQIVRAWELAYNRQPRGDELALAVKFIADQIRMMGAMPEAIPPGRTSVSQAMTNLCQSLLSSNEFLYVE
ncbi:PSD1 and planctomycete cytochrome C domain-containing protein [Stieleria sp. ICT_E10.1]|uniref:PSD1 and planctomycete cytochrome C domain-containing protein n=1 Tax=Stieleria sedimenti TaxID=2976331 RepID=UPI0021805017|nr:PSD1 and planctomycete cytochrome C domain-containing protein [Stieleria sedimenti]MCS7466905.1 PSD1 and planctomycete cytochrome C domain-containing protein [Stieleria sedimenti]